MMAVVVVGDVTRALGKGITGAADQIATVLLTHLQVSSGKAERAGREKQ